MKVEKEKIREMRLRWYGHMQRMEENNKVRAIVDMMVPGKDQERDGWIVSEGTCRNYGSPRSMLRTDRSGNQEFGPLTPPTWKRRRRMYIYIYILLFGFLLAVLTMAHHCQDPIPLASIHK